MMKKTLLIFAALLFSQMMLAQTVSFHFSDFAYSQTLKTKVEREISKLLTEINNACSQKRDINLSGINIESTAKSRLSNLWSCCPFQCEDKEEIIQPCLKETGGYQVRAIHLIMKPTDGTYKGDTYRELTISFNASGTITGVRLALKNTDAAKIMGSGTAVEDLAKRRMILSFVEDLRCYYNEKNLPALEKIYSDDAIIITGSVITRRQRGDMSCMKTEFKYYVQKKQEYMNSLDGIFKRNKYINIEFDQIEVVKHSSKKNFYGVRLHQKWETRRNESRNSHGYTDDGWVFLLWDFNNEAEPTIHVRTWQPLITDTSEVFGADDFFIP